MSPAHVLTETGRGVRFVLGHRLLRATLGYAATVGLCMSAVLAVYLLYLANELKLPPVVIGIVGIAAAPGTIVGALVASRLVRRWVWAPRCRSLRGCQDSGSC